MSDRIRAHWTGCHTSHIECALERLEEAQREIETLRKEIDKWKAIANHESRTLDALSAQSQKSIASPQPDRLAIAAQMMAAMLSTGNYYDEIGCAQRAMIWADALLAAHAEREGR